ncbi:hypothetical protein HDN1F_05350 [gamma proteobacterium HdN1]|nr:hypothetical protein HDN1F_05350 [gamma proteobacterium HdN1]
MKTKTAKRIPKFEGALSHAFIVGASLIALVTPAQADDGPVRFSGFGTVGIAHSNSDQADFRTAQDQRTGTARSDNYSTITDSKFAVQADATLAKGLTSTVQVLARQREDTTSSVDFEWLNLRYQIAPGFYARVGRVQTPMLMNSEYQNVGYSLTQLRAPQEVYYVNSLTYLDGLDLGYQAPIGDATLTAKLLGGKRKMDVQSVTTNADGLSSTSTYKFEFDLALATIAAEISDNTFRAACAKFKINADVDVYTLMDNALDALSNGQVSQAGALRNHLKTDKVDASFLTFGYAFDRDQYLVQAEYVISKADSNVYQDLDSWYFMAGYRIEEFTPYISYSKLRVTENYHLPAIDVASVDPSLLIPALTVNAFASGFMKSVNENTITAGVRWDALPNVALKAQGDYIRKPERSQGIFTNATPGFIAKKRNISVISASVDYIF